jgi:YegS/Rv2252/BmrU family lipid kinase
MSKKPVHLLIAVFNGQETAEKALAQAPKTDRHILSAVVMKKNAEEEVTFKDVGLTPGKGAAGGIVLGGVIGLLTGGTGLALGALGGLVGTRSAKHKQVEHLLPNQLDQVAGSLGPESSAIIAVSEQPLNTKSVQLLTNMGGQLLETIVQPEAIQQLDAQSDEAYEALLNALAEKTGGQPATAIPYPRIFIVINPVSGEDKPIINVLNRVFHKYGVEWDIGITRKYGDATEFARQAAESGNFDLVAGYGGDGTQHEIANGVIGTGVIMGVLPGGTGNGFANEMNIPKTLEPAVELLCISHNQRKIDVVQLEDGSYFIQRLFTGIEPEEQTSREDKDKYGIFAYLKRDIHLLRTVKDIPYHIVIDGEKIEVMGHKCYVVNSAKAGTGLSMSAKFEVDDGYLDVFMLNEDTKSIDAAIDRFFNRSNKTANMYYWRGKEISIDADPDQPVWTDGEYTARTPVSLKVLPKALTIAAP